MQASVFIATSLDGYIARSNGELDWLDAANEMVPVGEDCGYGEFMSKVNLLVMGRKTYEKVLTFGDWPFDTKPVIVLSRQEIQFPPHVPKTVSHSSEPPRVLCDRLNAEGVDRIYVDGGDTIQRFLAAGLIDDLTITIIPVILGEGIPLFGPLASDIDLTCVESRTFAWGFVQVKYAVKNDVSRR